MGLEIINNGCETLKMDPSFPMNNQIHGVSLNNKKRGIFWDLAFTWANENEVSCN